MTTIEPIPTEYAGITFRSKSEAIFARALDLMNYWWQYEPTAFQTGDLWKPDFLTVSMCIDHTLTLRLIEYKPSRPTDAYMSLTKKRTLEINPHLRGFLLMVFYGSSFNEDFGAFVWEPYDGDFYSLPKLALNPLIASIIEASRYRFDLQAPP